MIFQREFYVTLLKFSLDFFVQLAEHIIALLKFFDTVNDHPIPMLNIRNSP